MEFSQLLLFLTLNSIQYQYINICQKDFSPYRLGLMTIGQIQRSLLA